MSLTMLENAAAVLGVTGAFLLAIRSRVAGWAFVLWLGSNALWIAFGVAKGHWGLVAQNVVFAVTSGIGIWTWLVRPWQRKRRQVVAGQRAAEGTAS